MSDEAKKLLMQLDINSDQLWKMAEDPCLLEAIDELRHCATETRTDVDATDVAISLCATLVYGEIIKRKLRERSEENDK